MDQNFNNELLDQQQSVSKRLRLACDSCHRVKTRCTGGRPCEKCMKNNNECTYSYMAKLGKPKGARNKKTLEKLDQMAAQSGANPNGSTDSLPYLSRSAEPEQTPPASMTTPTPITPWMHWSALSSTGMGADEDLSMSLEEPNMHGLFDLDPALHSGPMDRNLLQFQMLTPVPTDPGHFSARSHFPGSYNGSEISPMENDKVGSEGGHSDTAFQHPTGLRIHTPPSSARERNLTRSSTPQVSHPSRNDEDEDRESGACECLKALTDQLCIMNTMERRHARIPIDYIFSKASKVLDHATAALGCPKCWIDSKVLLMIITVLQTVFNWAMQEQQSASKPQNIPAVVFGKWTVSEEESRMVKSILVDRVLTRSNSTTDVLRHRVNHISRMSNNKKVPYQVMDAVTLEFTLQRLTFSVREVIRCVKRDSMRPSSSA